MCPATPGVSWGRYLHSGTSSSPAAHWETGDFLNDVESARRYLQHNNVAAAIRALCDGLRKKSYCATSAYLLARCLLATGRAEEASRVLASCLRLGEDPRLFSLLIESALALGDIRAAMAVARRAAGRFPQDERLKQMLRRAGDLLSDEGDRSPAGSADEPTGKYRLRDVYPATYELDLDGVLAKVAQKLGPVALTAETARERRSALWLLQGPEAAEQSNESNSIRSGDYPAFTVDDSDFSTPKSVPADGGSPMQLDLALRHATARRPRAWAWRLTLAAALPVLLSLLVLAATRNEAEQPSRPVGLAPSVAMETVPIKGQVAETAPSDSSASTATPGGSRPTLKLSDKTRNRATRRLRRPARPRRRARQVSARPSATRRSRFRRRRIRPTITNRAPRRRINPPAPRQLAPRSTAHTEAIFGNPYEESP